MQTIRLKFKTLEIPKLDFKENIADLILIYEENGVENKFSRTYPLDKNPALFTQKIMQDIKTKTKEKYSVLIEDTNEIFSTYINIILDEKDEDETETKIVNALNRIKDKLKNLRTVKTSSDYMRKYSEFSRMKVNL